MKSRIGFAFLPLSSDGYLATEEDEGVDWLYQFSDADQDDGGFMKIISSCQAMVMGRMTYDHVAGMKGAPWPYGDTPVYVVTSQRPEKVTIPQHLIGYNIHVRHISDKFTLVNLMEHIEATHGATTVYVDGARTVRECVRLDLIQEMTLTEIPVTHGSGGIPFLEQRDYDRFSLKNQKTLKNGMIQKVFVSKS